MDSFSDKQEAFCYEYMKDSNATQAAIRAGYSKATAEAAGSRLLRNVKVKSKIAELQKANREIAVCSYEERLSLLWDLANDCKKLTFDEEGNGKPINPAAAVSAIDQINKMTGDHAAIKQKIDADVQGDIRVPQFVIEGVK